MSIVVGSEQVTKQDPGHMAGEQRPVSGTAVLASDVKVRVEGRPVGRAAEQEVPSSGKRLSLKARQRLRGAAIKGNGPGGRKLGRGEDVRLSPEASARLGELYEEYGARVALYARRKLLYRGTPPGVAGSLAEEIAQEAWVSVARTGAKDLLAPDAAARYSEDETRWMLWARVKERVQAHYKRNASYETAVDWEDRRTCMALCPVLEEELARRCQLGALPGYLAQMVAALPEAEREALLAVVYNVPQDQAAELLRDLGASGTPGKLYQRAVLLLLLDNPELSGPRVSVADLPRWQRTALGEVSFAQRQLLLRLEDFPREVLLLRITERLTAQQIADRLGVSRTRVNVVVSGCAALVAGGAR